MRKRVLMSILTAVLLMTAAEYAICGIHADEETVSCSELIDHSKKYDGKKIVFEGEAIGDILYRGSYAWINVSDGNNSAIGIWMTKEQAQSIKTTGAYEITGDTVEIAGIFHAACSEHGGDMDIHATAVTVMKQGYMMKEKTPVWLKMLSVAALTAAAALGGLFVYRKKQF